MAGRFVVFEGPEGSGKSTQIRRLADALAAAGQPVRVTREPGGTPLGDAIRALLLDPDDYAMLPGTEAFLLSAARAQHVHDVIRPALADGAIVLCDRFTDSSLAYQGGGHGMDNADLRCLARVATGGTTPDLRILLDLPVEEGLARRYREQDNVNRIDRAELAFHQRVRAAYLELVRACPDDWVVIDASQTADEVSGEVRQAVTAAFSIPVPADRCDVP